MEIKIRHVKKFGLVMAGSFFWFTALASAQSTPAQSDERNMEDRDRDSATRQELARFDQFLDSHREVAEQLRKNPTLVNDPAFVKTHPALQAYLQDHPRISQQLASDPNSFMRQEERYDRREDNNFDARRQELARFDQFLDSHKNIDTQLRKDPSLINNEQFLKDHSELQSYLQDHPRTREAITQDPNGFMRSEERYDRREDKNQREDRDRDMSRNTDRDRDMDRDADRDRGQRQAEVARFDQFLDRHREVSEQLRKNPSLVNDPTFVKTHPELQSYLQQHPMVRDDLARNPDAFIRQEANYEHREPSDLSAARTDRDARYDRDASRYDGRNQSSYNGSKDTAGDQGRTGYGDRDRDAMTSRSASFGEFLGTHSAIAHQLSNNPSLANDRSYLDSHPELQSYLSSHPEVRNELMQNPQGFMKAAQQYNGTNNTNKTAAPPTATAPPSATTPSQPSQPHH